jgi:hypothetical protein
MKSQIMIIFSERAISQPNIILFKSIIKSKEYSIKGLSLEIKLKNKIFIQLIRCLYS